jgi:dihydroorotate dehydrogenase electron transfer subunit
MIDTTATVERNSEIVPGYRLLTLNFEQEIRVRAGQFAMLKAHASYEPILRRALAVYRVEGPSKLSFLYQVLGRGTSALSRLVEGDGADVLLPLGNGWLDSYPDVSAQSASDGTKPAAGQSRRAIVVAGGVGSASVMMLCEQLVNMKTETRVFFGASTARVAAGCGLEDFKALELPLTLTTDDGSLGESGLVTVPLERHLAEGSCEGTTIYTCGPWKMMRRVAEIAAERSISCLASLEAPMGCGFGVCVGCVVAVRQDGPLTYNSYRRVCTDGSVFPAEIIRWDVEAMTH